VVITAAGHQPGAKLGIVRRPTETQLPQPGPRRPVPCVARHFEANMQAKRSILFN
jgi:hypothetical protein